MRSIGICTIFSLVLTGTVALCAAEKNDTEKKAEAKTMQVAEKYAVGSQKPAKKAEEAKKETAAPAGKKAPAKQKAASASKGASKDKLVIIGRVTEIPGKFAPNDLYNYVYVMKYRVLKVLSGSLKKKNIYIGHYNPLIPRNQIKDKMAAHVKGDVEKFEEGGKHRLVLDKPIEKYWKEAKEDEYIDIDDSEKYFALQADVAK